MSLFFIKRPVFAWVIAIIIMLSGILSIKQLPIEQYPNILPPIINIEAHYPGASADIVENSVTQVIEQNLNGIDNVRYFRSSSSSSGTSHINVTFEPGTNADTAQVQVQNKVQKSIALLPKAVQGMGLTVTKGSSGFLLVAGFYSDNKNITQQELGDLLHSKMRDALARINGVGNVTIFGNQKAMRIWLNPHKMNAYNLTIQDIRSALSTQNSDVSAGQLGGAPAVKGQQINVSITSQSTLKTVDDFEKIILRVKEDGSQVRLKDVARVELGANNYDLVVRYKKKPAAGIGISLATGANALETASAVKEKIAELMQFMPKDVKFNFPYDNTPFIKLAIKEVIFTLLEAVLLVFLVMFIFLQNFRATIIPTIAVPIVILGTFTMLYIFGFTINVLTMFAMVLAIGLLVDDAIVVVENVERLMHEQKLNAKDATIQSMKQITGALIGIAVVLSSVFVPMMFFGGSAGVIYKQFSFTIASAMMLSVVVAIILSPTLCARILKPISNKEFNLFKKFNEKFDSFKFAVISFARLTISNTKKYFFVYFVIVITLFTASTKVPKSFLPNEDQGIMFVMINTPPGSSIERTLEKVKQVEDYFISSENSVMDHLFTVTGFGFNGIAQNTALGFVNLKDWSKRTKKEDSVFSIASRSMGALSKIKDAFIYAFYPPSIPELGDSSGFSLNILDRNGIGHQKMMDMRNTLFGMSAQNPKLSAVRPQGLSDVPQFNIKLDHEKASALGLNISDVNDTLRTAWGSEYVNNFLDNNRVKRVYIQGDAQYRMMPSDIKHWHIRNNQNKMVPLDTISTFQWNYGSPKLERFNGDSSIGISGSSAPGVSSGDAMNEIEKIVKSLPEQVGLEWSGLSFEEKQNASKTTALYIMSLITVFLCLAALYESWSVPIAVLLAVPLGVVGTVFAALIFKLNNDVYFQVALLTTIGLTSKNAILIVEFAKTLIEDGHDAKDAIIHAMKIRFRPIIMTSMAFVLGVMPLAITSGVGAASQNAIGISVIGGMLTATFLATLFVPMFYYIIHIFNQKMRS